MRRGKSGSAVRETVVKLREAIPGLTLRTSLIVGFPGETEADFIELLDFVEEAKFERLGVFKYSEEEGTPAADLQGKVSDREKERRWQEVMELQAAISQKKNEALIGSIQRVMIEGVDVESGKLTGRTQAHAPEVDGSVYIDDAAAVSRVTQSKFGEIVDVKVIDALEYDLVGEIVHA
jgi:ribosomal protein S12 methylthiotransferase